LPHGMRFAIQETVARDSGECPHSAECPSEGVV
jgi:hypothetical protein